MSSGNITYVVDKLEKKELSKAKDINGRPQACFCGNYGKREAIY